MHDDPAPVPPDADLPVPGASGQVTLFSAAMLPAAIRMEIWREAFGREVVHLDMAPLDDGPFRYDAAFRMVNDISIGAGAVSALSCERTPDLVRDGNNDILILIPMEGRIRITQHGQDFLLRDGEALVRRSDDPGLTRSAAGRYLTVTIPERELARRLTDADRLTLSTIPADAEGLALLRHYALMLLAPGTGAACGKVAERLAAEHLADLASLVIGAGREAWHLADIRGGAAARLLRIDAEIAAHAREPGYTIEALSQALRLSPGHLRKLMAGDRHSFSRRLRDTRLRLAAEALTDPRRAADPVSAIAYDSGFSDISHFNRAFRAEFGMTPREMREAGG